MSTAQVVLLLLLCEGLLCYDDLLLSSTIDLLSGSRIKRQNCGFQCKQGNCIDAKKACDGETDCADGSDESVNACINLFLPAVTEVLNNELLSASEACPSGKFRCNIGGCIDSSLKCNGQRNCPDGSDENLTECPASVSNPSSSVCRNNEFSCGNNKCIDKVYVCNGKKDCPDGSDERRQICQTVVCPNDKFQCKSGACIQAAGRCDGKVDCEEDSSDENPAICYHPAAPPQCILPKKPENGGYIIEGCEPPNCEKAPGSTTAIATLLTFFCSPGFSLQGSPGTFCRAENTWTTPPPICKKDICPPLISTSLNIECTYSGKEVSCDQPMEPGTTAEFICKQYYVPTIVPDYTTLTCGKDGKWDKPLHSCSPVCGKRNARGVTLISGGKPVLTGEFPWHVGVYLNKEEKWEQICSGSLISTQFVLSAAHCFYNEVTETVGNKEDYKIVAGKFYRDYYKAEKYAQPRDVEFIHIKREYRGLKLDYDDDISVIVVDKEFEINAFVQPVCIDRQTTYEYFHFRTGRKGVVTGWGFTETNKESDVLLTARLPFVDVGTCGSNVPESFQRFVTREKFCAGDRNGTTVCNGDSGGGIFFEENLNPPGPADIKYFVQGVVSLGVPSPSGEKCSVTDYALFTKVSFHMNWLRNYV